MEKYKEAVHGYQEELHIFREQNHGVIVKNEAVLLQTLEVNNIAFDKLNAFDNLLKNKHHDLQPTEK